MNAGTNTGTNTTAAEYVPPTPQEVGEFYDHTNHLLTEYFGGSMHYGYWTGPNDRSTFQEASQRFTDLLAQRLGAGPDDVVVDVGCGTGRPAVQLSKTTGARVVGISISARDVERATALAAAEGVSDRVRFQHANAMDMPFPDDSFTAGWAFESLGHMPDRSHVLKQMARVLRPGSRIVGTDAFTKGNVSSGARHAAHSFLSAWAATHQVQLDDYRHLLPGAGMRLVELVDVTENVKYSNLKLFEQLSRGRRQDPNYPPELVRLADAMQAMVFYPEAVDKMGGYLMFVAELPGTELPAGGGAGA